LPKTDYEERREAKKDRYQELSDKNKKKSEDGFDQAHKMADVIPMGQPILVGHHSEQRDRNYRAKINRKYEKSFEDGKKSEYYKDKVKTIENNYAISQDDPEAIKRYKEKIQGLIESREETKRLKIIQRDYSFSKEDMRSVHLTSLGAEIRRCKKKIEDLQALDKVKAEEWKNNNITLEVNKDENRIMLYFPGKPDEEIRTKLKRHGFRWSPTNQAWQSYINQWNLDFAKKEILKIA